VVAVRDQRRTADLAADTDAEDRDRFVAQEPDDRRDDHRGEVRDGLRMEQPVDRLVGCDSRAEDDHQDDGQPREVFDTAEPIGEAAAGGPTPSSTSVNTERSSGCPGKESGYRATASPMRCSAICRWCIPLS